MWYHGPRPRPDWGMENSPVLERIARSWRHAVPDGPSESKAPNEPGPPHDSGCDPKGGDELPPGPSDKSYWPHQN
jgi:hypothetical protein